MYNPKYGPTDRLAVGQDALDAPRRELKASIPLLVFYLRKIVQVAYNYYRSVIGL